MASIRREVFLDVPAAQVWDAVRDVVPFIPGSSPDS